MYKFSPCAELTSTKRIFHPCLSSFCPSEIILEWEQTYPEVTLPPSHPPSCGNLNAGPPSLQEMTLSSANYSPLLQQFSLLFPLVALLTIHLQSFACWGLYPQHQVFTDGRLAMLHPGNLLSFWKPSLDNPEKTAALGTPDFLIPFSDRCRGYFLTPLYELLLCA